MNDHVSFGSQPQYRPHASCAQIAPAITANVQIGNANAITRYAIRSSVAAVGRNPRGGPSSELAMGSSAPGAKSGGVSSSTEPPMIGLGSCAANCASCVRSRASCTRYRIVRSPPPSANSDEPVIAATTWILIQYEFNAGTSGPGPTYRNDTAIAI